MSQSTRAQNNQLQETLEAALTRLQALEDLQRQTSRDNDLLREQVDSFRARQQQQPQDPAAVLPTVREPSFKEPKVSSPEPFTGRVKSQLPNFLLGVNIVLSTQPSRFPNEITKVQYTISYLRDEAKAWVEPFATKATESQPAFMKNFDLFVKELKTIFGDPDEVATAEREIRRLRQKGPASTYFAEFRRLAAVLDWNDSALSSQAYAGLKDLIKDEFARTGRPETLNELITIATRIDNRLYERRIERDRGTEVRSYGSSASNSTTITAKGPAVISVKRESPSPPTKRGPLPEQEKERRHGSPRPPKPHSDCTIPTSAAVYQVYDNSEFSASDPFSILKDSPTLELFSSSTGSTPILALLDTGATRNYVDSEFAHKHSLELNALKTPISVLFADGSSSPELATHTITLNVRTGSGPSTSGTFFVTSLKSHDVFLGMPWFRNQRAIIDLGRNVLRYHVLDDGAEQKSNLIKASPSSPTSLNSNTELSSNLQEVTLTPEQRQAILNSQNFEQPVPEGQVRSITTSPLVNSAGMTEDDIIRSILPKSYHDFVDVFRKSSADELPEHRPYDHKIPLIDGNAPPPGPIYSLTDAEHQELRKYLRENLAKGFIRPSSSSTGSPVLFVPKSDKTLRLCVDYRKLNNVTVKDRYAIPKIDDLLDRIVGAIIFSKVDLRGAYNLLRIALGEEWKTCFRTRYGSFEYLVMPFGLCNAPSSFQRFMNDVFKDMVDVFVVIYLDDILIFSKNIQDHERHVKAVLARLRSVKLFAKAEKCEFSKDSVEFLGYHLSKDGVTMVTDKVSSILSWQAPASVKELQSFLGFANFYRRFIWRYSQLVSPLTALLRKDTRWDWTDRCQDAFDKLKTAFTTAPVLQHFDPAKPITLETDASDYAIAAVASQPDTEGKLRPIAYRSRKMNSAELNYDIHDKEMLAIVDTLKDWRHLLLDSRHTITVFTDHKNLVYFTTSKLLTRRQARWALLLTEYDFMIIYRPGHQGGKPDALTRRTDYHPGTAARHYADHNAHNVMTLLPEGKHDLSPSSLVARATFTVQGDVNLQRQILSAYVKDEHAQNILKDPVGDYSLATNGLILHKSRIYIPSDMRIQIIKSRHDHPLAGHPGRRKTLALLRRDYFWPGMKQLVHEYVDTCDLCARTKVPRHKPFGLLKPLPIAERPWSSISMDLIEGLPASHKYDCILVIVDRLTKMSLFIPTHSNMTAQDLAKLYLQHVFSKHGRPENIVSDRGSEFTSSFWRSLCKLLGIEQSLSTAYHPQTDGQTERVNQNLEQYLRLFTNYQQNDWVDLLPLAEFTYNNTDHSSTGISPFMANKGYSPAFDVTPQTVYESPAAHPDANSLVQNLGEVHQYLKEQIRAANEASNIAYDRKHAEAPTFDVGDMVMLSAKNIRTTRPSKKLDHRALGPYKITKKISSHAYRLDLPKTMRIHNVFHVSLLTPHKANSLPKRVIPPPPPIEIDGDVQYEVEQIVDSKMDNRYACRLRYRVQWSGYSGDDQYTWEGADQLNCPRHVEDFHHRHPEKPGPSF